MKAVIAYRDADDTPEALELGAMLRRTTGCDLVVAAVLPPTSVDTLEGRGADSEYRAWLDKVAEEAEAAARAALDGEGRIEFVRVASASVAGGLISAVEKADGDVLVLGSARDAVEGSLLAGSVATRLLHSSPVPILLAPQGYVGEPGAKFESLTCAYVGTDQSDPGVGRRLRIGQAFRRLAVDRHLRPTSRHDVPPTGGLRRRRHGFVRVGRAGRCVAEGRCGVLHRARHHECSDLHLTR